MNDDLPTTFYPPKPNEPASPPPVSQPSDIPASSPPIPPPIVSEPAVTTGFADEEKPRSNKKVIVAALALILVVASTAAAVYLAGQRQEVRKEAAASADLYYCTRWGAPPAGYSNPAIEGYFGNSINFYRNSSNPSTPGEEVMYRCDYQSALADAGGDVNRINCDEDDYLNNRSLPNGKSYRTIGCDSASPSSGDCYSHAISDFIDQSHYGGKCQVIQIDMKGCNSSDYTYRGNDVNGNPIERKYPGWAGGTAFVIAYNSECPAATPTPGGLTCSSLTSNPQPATRKPGESINLTCTGAGQGINHFEFQVTIDSGAPIALPSVAATGTTGQISYPITEYGCYKIECRACPNADSTGCTTWGLAR